MVGEKEMKIGKTNFYKKVWYSITKFEKYPEMAAEGVKRALLYLFQVIIIFSFVIASFRTIRFIQNGGKEEIQAYKTALKQLEVDNEEKEKLESLLPYIEEMSITTEGRLSFFSAMFIGFTVAFFISTLFDILILSIFGMLTAWIAKMTIRYRAVFNMSVYAVTISVLLELIYIGVNVFLNFEVKYFDLMYTAIAYICLTAAIFMIKSDVIRQQIELLKIIKMKEENGELKKEEEQQKKEEEKKIKMKKIMK